MDFILFDDSIIVFISFLMVLPVLSSSSCWKAYLLNRQTHFWGKHISLHEKPLFRVHTPLKPHLFVLYSNFNRKLILSVYTPSLDGCLIWMAAWLANWLAGCPGGWLADGLAGCLAGWLATCPVMFQNPWFWNIPDLRKSENVKKPMVKYKKYKKV